MKKIYLLACVAMLTGLTVACSSNSKSNTDGSDTSFESDSIETTDDFSSDDDVASTEESDYSSSESSDESSDESSTESSSSSSSSIDAALDAYDEAVDEYEDLAKQLKKDPEDMSAMSQLTSFTMKVNEAQEKLANSRGEFTAAQLARYNKIVAKMATIAASIK